MIFVSYKYWMSDNIVATLFLELLHYEEVIGNSVFRSFVDSWYEVDFPKRGWILRKERQNGQR